MKHPIRTILLALILGAVAAGLYFYMGPRAPEAPPPVAVAPPDAAPDPAAAAEPGIQFPVAPAAVLPTLPSLEDSDPSFAEGLASLFGAQPFKTYFIPQNLIRRIVATVDNLPRETSARRLLPVKSASGLMLVTGDGERREIGAANATRYLPFVVLAESVDAKKLVAIYIQHYPLFQQAYRELGFPTQYFNDRLVQVIDHLLATPEVSGPIELVRRKVLYKFADPELEARSAGQKIMIRIGTANAARLKARLRDIRGELTNQSIKP